ncbi:outer membrane protein assembly factor BamA [Salidesulfovibrio brasiliensis]|uniref:outer membrane protein assembly factor BamA n=1 Tax=Salidesulfovibrio brasiliensis TaxID=221711 RepID=UPI001FDF5A75|nr:outer membrane protein assembly factor BamA [Salidesulfovibrio brasiliensis]
MRGDDDKTEDILETIVTKKGAVVNPKVLADDIKTISDMYRKDGFYKAKVTHEIESNDSGLAKLTFVIEPGQKMYVEDIVIDGAKQVDPDDVKDVLALQERGMLSWFTDSGVLKEEFLERDAAAIMAFYNNNGFLQARVGSPDIEVTDDGLRIVYRVWEGPRFKMGETRFKGDLIESPEKLKEVVGVDDLAVDDEWFNRSLIREDVKNLTEYYNNYGYAHADVQIHLEDLPEAGIVNVEYTIAKHQRVHIRRVLIEGNTATRDNVILREMRLADGDMYSGSKVNRSMQRLNALGYFETVDISPVQTGNPDEMDLLVKVKDAPTGNIGGGIGYSSYDGVYLAAKISERNLFGKGYQLAFSGAFSSKKTEFSLDFVNPYIYDSDVGMKVNLFSNARDESDYDLYEVGSNLSFFYPIGEYTKLNWSYGARYYEITNVSSDASNSTREDAGSHFASTASGTITRSTLNSTQFPSDGTKTSLSLIMGGGILGGTDDFMKELGTFDYYTELYEDLVFHGKAAMGFVHENLSNSDIPTSQRFKLGGISSVRGYSNYKITAYDDNGTLGGNKQLYTNLELLYLLSEEYGIQLVTFFDAGNVWKEGEMFFEQVDRKGIEAPSLGVYKSVGAGFRWLSPMGPIRVEYGHGLDDLYDSGTNKVELMMGQSF